MIPDTLAGCPAHEFWLHGQGLSPYFASGGTEMLWWLLKVPHVGPRSAVPVREAKVHGCQARGDQAAYLQDQDGAACEPWEDALPHSARQGCAHVLTYVCLGLPPWHWQEEERERERKEREEAASKEVDEGKRKVHTHYLSACSRCPDSHDPPNLAHVSFQQHLLPGTVLARCAGPQRLTRSRRAGDGGGGGQGDAAL